MKVAIIGGGYAGLGALWELVQRGHSVTLFEKSSGLGGLAGTMNIGGAELENFYHHLFPTYYDFFEVTKELGVRDTIFFKRAKMGIYYGGRVYPFSGPLDLLRFQPLSFLEKAKTGFLLLWMKLVRNWQRFENVTAAEWLVKHFGLKIYQVLWEPLLAAKFGRHLKTVGMAWFWSRIYERPQKFGYFTGSFKTLTSALERRLNERGAVIHLSTAVAGLQPVGSQMAVITDSQREVFDKVIIAAPPEPFLRIAGPHLPCDFAERIAKLQYVGTVCAVLVLSRPFSEYYWLNINDSTSPFLALIEQTNFVAPEVYGGKHIVYLSRYIDPAEDFYRLPEDAIWDSFLPWVKKINPEFSENWILEKHLFRAPFTQPVIPPAYGKIRPPYKTPLASLWWVSMSHIYPWDRGTDHSFHAGRELVREMLEGARAV